jgi:hypothetical protein
MIDAVNEAIYNKLNGTSAVTTLLSSATAVYFHQAPTTAIMPYIVYILAGGGSDNDTPVDSGDLAYYIKGVAETASTAGAIAVAIYNALHEASMSIDSPWSVYRCQHNEPLMFPENAERKQFWHSGGSYRIRISQ